MLRLILLLHPPPPPPLQNTLEASDKSRKATIGYEGQAVLFWQVLVLLHKPGYLKGKRGYRPTGSDCRQSLSQKKHIGSKFLGKESIGDASVVIGKKLKAENNTVTWGTWCHPSHPKKCPG